MISEVRPQVSGIILMRLFTEGGKVVQGQPLYQIDPSIYQANYAVAMASLAQGQAAYATADAKAARFRPLAAAQAVSEQDYDDAEAAALEAKAAIATARANIQLAHIDLVYTKILSPISGIIGSSTVTQGALVSTDQANALAVVTQLDPIYVDLNESSTEWLRLKRDMVAGSMQSGAGALKVKLTLEDGSLYPLSGTLQFSEVEVDAGTGTVLIRALFANPQQLLLPGMYVHAQIEEGIDQYGILLPQIAVSRNTHGDATVLVAGADNKAELRIIQTGPAVGADWVVTGGLKPGDRVIVDGLLNIQPGALVAPVAEPGTASKSSSGS